MNSVGNLKVTQFEKLLRFFYHSLMQSLRIFGATENIRFQFAIQAIFGKIGKFLERADPTVSSHFQTAPFSDSVATFRQRVPRFPSSPVGHRPPVFTACKGGAWLSRKPLSHFSFRSHSMLHAIATSAVLFTTRRLAQPSSPALAINDDPRLLPGATPSSSTEAASPSAPVSSCAETFR
jgi:hypothetical protein